MSTVKQLRKQANEAPKYVLFTSQFGHNMFIADEEKTGKGMIVTDNTTEALHYSVGFDNPEMKLAYWKFKTGYDLQIKEL